MILYIIIINFIDSIGCLGGECAATPTQEIVFRVCVCVCVCVACLRACVCEKISKFEISLKMTNFETVSK